MSLSGPQAPPLPMLVVMGVSGSGKSTIAAQLAGRIGAAYLDADDLHPAANVAKMRSGTPLNDDDRWPWLDRVAAELLQMRENGRGVVMACSALRRIYRDRLRAGTGGAAKFVFLQADFGVIHDRMAKRLNHFMPEALLRSQFATLEQPADDEIDVQTIAADRSPEAILAAILSMLETVAGSESRGTGPAPVNNNIG